MYKFAYSTVFVLYMNCNEVCNTSIIIRLYSRRNYRNELGVTRNIKLQN